MTDQTAQSRRERRVARRKEAIMKAAAAVFAEQGFHRATTKDIAEAADIAEGTIYNYFQSKDDLMFAILDHLASLDTRRVEMEQALDIDLREYFTQHIKGRMELLQENRPFIAAVLPELLSSPPLRERYMSTLYKSGIEMVEEHLKTRQKMGQLPSLDIYKASQFITATMVGVTMMTLLGEDTVMGMWSDPTELANTMVAFTFEGLDAFVMNPEDSVKRTGQSRSDKTSEK